MPQQDNETTTSEILTVNEPDAIQMTTTSVEEVDVKKPFWKSWRFLFSVIGLILFLGLIWGIVYVFNVFTNSSRYKKAYDIAVEELNYCDSIEGTSQPKEKFDDCDKIQEKFREIERN